MYRMKEYKALKRLRSVIRSTGLAMYSCTFLDYPWEDLELYQGIIEDRWILLSPGAYYCEKNDEYRVVSTTLLRWMDNKLAEMKHMLRIDTVERASWKHEGF